MASTENHATVVAVRAPRHVPDYAAGEQAYLAGHPYQNAASAKWRAGWLAMNRAEAYAYTVEIIEMSKPHRSAPADWPGELEQTRLAAKSRHAASLLRDGLVYDDLRDEPGYEESRHPYWY